LIHDNIVENTTPNLGTLEHSELYATAFASIENAIGDDYIFKVPLRRWPESNTGPPGLQVAVGDSNSTNGLIRGTGD
jgi:hypothetical protein